MGLILIVLSASCSLLIAHFLKYTETYRYSTMNVLVANYFAALVTAVGMNVYAGLPIIPDFPVWFWIFSAFIGSLFIASIFLLSKSVHLNGMGVSVAAMRVSVVVPVLFSIFFYGEIITVSKITGIILVLAAIVILISARREIDLGGVNSRMLLLALFMCAGFTEGSLKVYDEEMSRIASEAHFMSAVFLFAGVIGVGVGFRQKQLQKLKLREIGLGTAVGIPNLLTSIFLIKAFTYFDASIVYSVINMLIVVGGAVIGLLVWKDKVGIRDWFGMGIAVLAIIILTTSVN